MWAPDPAVVLHEMRSYAHALSFDELLRELAYGEEQEGAPRGSIDAPLVIGWGRQDKVCFPFQAKRALSLFPDAQMHWFERCGHFRTGMLPMKPRNSSSTPVHGGRLLRRR